MYSLHHTQAVRSAETHLDTELLSHVQTFSDQNLARALPPKRSFEA